MLPLPRITSTLKMPELRLRLHASWRHIACAAGSCKRSPGTRGGTAWALCNMQTDFFTFIGGCCCCCCCFCCRLVCGKHSASKPIPTQFHKRTSPACPLPPLSCCAFVVKKFFSELSRKKRKHKSGEWTIERGQSRIRRKGEEALLLLSFSASVV